MIISRGNIYMADIPIVENSSVQGGIRPVVVVQNDIGNAHAPIVQVIPLTSQSKHNLPVHIKIYGYGLAKESTLLTEQIQTIDQKNLGRYLGHVDDDTMQEINKCIAVQLGLIPIYNHRKGVFQMSDY